MENMTAVQRVFKAKYLGAVLATGQQLTFTYHGIPIDCLAAVAAHGEVWTAARAREAQQRSSLRTKEALHALAMAGKDGAVDAVVGTPPRVSRGGDATKDGNQQQSRSPSGSQERAGTLNVSTPREHSSKQALRGSSSSSSRTSPFSGKGTSRGSGLFSRSSRAQHTTRGGKQGQERRSLFTTPPTKGSRASSASVALTERQDKAETASDSLAHDATTSAPIVEAQLAAAVEKLTISSGIESEGDGTKESVIVKDKVLPMDEPQVRSGTPEEAEVDEAQQQSHSSCAAALLKHVADGHFLVLATSTKITFRNGEVPIPDDIDDAGDADGVDSSKQHQAQHKAGFMAHSIQESQTPSFSCKSGEVKAIRTKSEQSQPSFEAIGGLEKQLREVRETITLSLHHPEVFTSYGLPCPRGVLLVGPPGTGKTLIARTVAANCDAQFSTINGPEMLSRTYGETESKLALLFKKASGHGKHVIFIDEIDSMCPRRDGGASDLEKRIVTVMLTLMDGIASKTSSARVAVLAATNKPDAIDPALRRPGRFDREIEIGVPSSSQRRDILQKLLGGYNHALSVEDIHSVSDVAHGFVGADLAALCREAGLHAIKRNVSDVKPLKEPANSDTAANSLQVTLDDVMYGLSVTRPSALREVLVDVPNVKWADIGGQEDVKQCLKEAIEWPMKYAASFQRLGIRPPKGVLLYGPPGCSKTLTAKALATESQLNFIAIKGPELFSKWVGESERAVREVFRKARAAAPCIVFFDEIDAFGAKRGGDEGSSVGDRVLTQLLVEMDGVSSLKDVTVIAATNRPDLVDDALLRPGRFDRKIYVGPPDAHTRAEILRINLARMPHSDELDVAALASACEGFSGAEVASVCREAAMLHLEETCGHPTVVPSRCFFEAAATILPNITQKMRDFYAAYRSQA